MEGHQFFCCFFFVAFLKRALALLPMATDDEDTRRVENDPRVSRLSFLPPSLPPSSSSSVHHSPSFLPSFKPILYRCFIGVAILLHSLSLLPILAPVSSSTPTIYSHLCQRLAPFFMANDGPCDLEHSTPVVILDISYLLLLGHMILLLKTEEENNIAE